MRSIEATTRRVVRSKNEPVKDTPEPKSEGKRDKGVKNRKQDGEEKEKKRSAKKFQHKTEVRY